MYFTVVEYDSADQRVYICDFDLFRNVCKLRYA